jgi:uncharacterized protein
MHNAINWFEIPAADFERAVNFYNTVLGIDIRKGEFMGEPQGFFPGEEMAVRGAIVKSDRLTPSTSGTLIYLNAGTVEGLEGALSRVEANGGTIMMLKTDIGEAGFIGILQDTEGNCVGLHALRPA